MLLSPIFLALGAVATSVLNADGRFAAAALAPIVYNLAIIGAALILAPSYGRRRASPSASSLGSLSPPAGPGPAAARLGFRFEPRIDLGDAAGAQGAGADGAAGDRPRRQPDHLRRGRRRWRRASASARSPRSTSRSRCSRSRSASSASRSAWCVFPSLSREAATGASWSSSSLLDRALRLLLYVMVPIGALAAILRVADRRAAVRLRPLRPRR